ncbi:hypothetical protein HYT57_05045 [Candidatus Woesearchaeota archaeon]|nr:hypothetical protein [Candidatus Woesearchaeota archaeon]
MVQDKVVEKLRTLKVFPDKKEKPNSVRTNAGIFERCTTLEQFKREDLESCGDRQFVYFHLNALLEFEPDYKTRFLEEAKQRLAETGITPRHIEKYFQSGADNSLVFTMTHGPNGLSEDQYPMDVLRPFYSQADQFALDKMREWLGLH